MRSPCPCGTTRPTSWIAVWIETGEGVLETFSRETVERIDRTRFEVLCAGEYLARLNRSIRAAK